MQDFEFYLPTRIIFGKEALKRFPKEITPLGRRILLIYGQGSIKKIGLYERLILTFKELNLQWEEFGGIKSNPTLKQVKEAIQLARVFNPDYLLAVGGGSVIDAAKGVACGYYYEGEVWDLYERRDTPKQALPLVVISTIAGSGSEANDISVIANEEKGFKLSLRSPLLYPKLSFIDPSLSFTVPKEYIAYGVIDAFSHLFEYFIFRSHKEPSITEDLLVFLMKNILKWGLIAFEEPENYAARSQLHWASLLALSPLTRAGLGSYRFFLHSLEHPLSGSYPIAHGLGLAILIRAFLKLHGAHDGVRKFYQRVLEIAPGPHLAKRGLKTYESILYKFGLPKTLKEVGIPEEALESLVEKAWEIIYIWKADKSFKKTDLEMIYKTAMEG